MLLKKLRDNFELKSNILRADFFELQRQENELQTLENFIKGEINQSEIFTSVQTYHTHLSYLDGIKK
jgi:hypothetical protein